MIRDWALDLVVVNGENSAGGFGITEAIYQELLDAGADAITLGNHAWDQREALVFIERAPRLIRPANFPRGTPGRGSVLVETRRGQRARARGVSAARRRRCDRRRLPLRGNQREARRWLLLRWPRQPRRRHAY